MSGGSLRIWVVPVARLSPDISSREVGSCDPIWLSGIAVLGACPPGAVQSNHWITKLFDCTRTRGSDPSALAAQMQVVFTLSRPVQAIVLPSGL